MLHFTTARLGRRPRGERALLTLTLAAATMALAPADAAASRFVTPAADADLLTRTIERADDEKSLSPYFVILSEQDEDAEALPLKFTAADVEVAGVIADVVVTQIYANTGSTPIEAKYVFPASTQAAVYGMTMTIGDRIIEADIQRKAEARATYEQARAEGRSASLLEQQRPNVFEMNVANIMPGDEIQVELRYTEMLVPTDGIYEFVYPTVVGPRYSETPAVEAPADELFVQSPYLAEGNATPYDFDFTATLSTGIPIQGIGSPSHEMDFDFRGPNLASATLDESEIEGGNRDVVLRYRLAGGKVESGLLLYEGEDENFFMLMAQPPRTVTPEIIPPREYIFVVDVSGSMNGYPLDVSKALMADLIGGLRPTDTFNVVLFASASNVMADRSVAATEANMRRAVEVIDNQRGGGGTRLLPALQTAMDLPRARGASRSIVVVTDGYISVESQTFDLIREKLDEANLFAFGIGSSVNRHLIEGMARVGQGEPLVILNQKEAAAKAKTFRQYIEAPVLTQVTAQISGLDVYDLDPPAIPDVLAQRPVVVVGKYRGQAQGKITLSGYTGDGEWSQRFDVGRVEPLRENDALRYLWARQRIATLDDYNQLSTTPERVEEVTQLGLNYNLLTAYTSFVAVDSLRRNTSGEVVHVDQPLPLPEGVSNLAVGASMGLTEGIGGLGTRGGGAGGGGYGSAVSAGAMGFGRGQVKRKSSKPLSRSDSATTLLAPSAPPPPAAEAVSAQREVKVSEDKKVTAEADEVVEGAVALADGPAKAEGKNDASALVSVARIRTLAVDIPMATALAEVKAHAAGLSAWYAQARRAEAGLTGRLMLELTLDGHGRVVSVKAVGGAKAVLESGELAGLIQAASAWRFTAPTNGDGGHLLVEFTLG